MRIITATLLSLMLLFHYAFAVEAQEGWQDLHGKQTQMMLTESFSNTAADCGGVENPAHRCTGILLRGTNHFSTSYHVWDPSPSSVQSGGVSFSYLRKDAKFSKLAYSYGTGMLFYPQDMAPEDKITLNILCAFPIDAATNGRSAAGCGQYSGDSAGKPCQSQGITTHTEWYNHYVQYGRSHTSQCGFGLDTAQYSDTADAFYQTLLSMADIASESFNQQNELRIATWAQGIPTQLPLQAFFYLNGNSTALSDAQKNQQDFYNETNGMYIPVINVTLPKSATDNVIFSYQPADQTETDTLLVDSLITSHVVINTSGENTTALLMATVKSSNGEPIEGARVVWSATAPGVLSRHVALTNSKGECAVRLTASEAGNIVVAAIGPDGSHYKTVVVVAKQSEGNDSIAYLSVDKSSIVANGSDKATVTAHVVDSQGAQAPGISVNWKASLGQVSSVSSVTDSQGDATTQVTSTTTGQDFITATLDNGSSQTTWVDVTPVTGK